MTTKTEELWQELHDSLRTFIARRVSDQGHVDDILQDVFVRVHRQIDSVSDPGRLIAWIYQVTRNAIIDHHRKPGRQREIPSGLSAELEGIDEVAETSTTTHPGDVAKPHVELAHCLRPMIERLSKDYRDAINLVKLEGLTQQAAATQLGLSLSGMKSRVQRGRARLKQMLDDCCLIELDRRRAVVDYKVRDTECNSCKPSSPKADK